MSHRVSPTGRRSFLRALSAGAALATVSAIAHERDAAANPRGLERWIATPPPGFHPANYPGLVVKVEKGSDFASLMQPDQLWPKPEVARSMLERALCELTSEATLNAALGRFFHPNDRVALKVNGISGQTGYTMAFNYELIEPLIAALIELGVAAEHITVFEQFPEFLRGTRVAVEGYPLPSGVKIETHNNRDARMPFITVFNRVKTRYVRQVTESTAILNLTTIKDHHLCGMTGALKNLTHGQIVNPQDHHAARCDPQIPLLYNHPIVSSRARLHIADAFKLIYDLGPLDREPTRRIPHGAVYASTDPVALDTVGHRVLDAARVERGLKPLAEVHRAPTYLHTASEIGLGVGDWNRIRLKTIQT